MLIAPSSDTLSFEASPITIGSECMLIAPSSDTSSFEASPITIGSG
jgi:hypothetical protein